ncbi:metallophosphoesterase [Litorivicinus lipolyticus]|uniref:metallophosphoesterase n=1 Tax=Litorivicinus lipolyticus TaxID=418701 RepID=UPI00147935C6|nr:metallophosphoesterase [Litorivicinus lipolyticus]
MSNRTVIDLIGDVHGCGQSLGRLLRKLGYEYRDGAYRHSERHAVFIGDLMDRGPRVRLACQIARAMVEAGNATWILGNHEIDVMGLVLGDGIEPYLDHTKRRLGKAAATFNSIPGPELLSLCQWLQDCPLWLEQADFRAVHACWDDHAVARIRTVAPDGIIARQHFGQLYRSGELQRAVSRLVRGPSLPLPNGQSMVSRDGTARKSFRVAFWLDEPDTLGDLVFQPDPLPPGVAEQPLNGTIRAGLPSYASNQPHLFFGHYWRRGRPAPLAENVMCLDYSAVLREKLVAYRHRPGQALIADQFEWVDAAPEWT